jgi:hypothetical protein
MPQNKPASKLDLRARLKLPLPNPIKEKSLFEEYPYAFFVAAFVLITVLAKAAGMTFRDALILGAWLVSIAFFAWQILRYRKHKSAPKLAKQAAVPRKPEPAKSPRGAKKQPPRPVKVVSELTVSETKPPRWPPPPPRLVAPLSVTLAKKAKKEEEKQPEQTPKPPTEQNSKQ